MLPKSKLQPSFQYNPQHIWILLGYLLQFKLTFKVADEDKAALQDVTIKIKDDEGLIVPLKTNAID